VTGQNLALLLSYQGTDFFGWQKNKMGPTVEEELQNVLEQIYQHPCPLQAASRTDRGVHATGQVVQFYAEKKVPLSRLLISINQLLPPSIAVRQIQEVPKTFHPTLDAQKKRYLYRLYTGVACPPLLRHFVWHYPYFLDLNAMRACCTILTGTKDYKAFCNFRKDLCYESTVRHVEEISFHVENDLWTFSITGTNFLYKMVRNLVGTLLHVGRKKLTQEDVERLFTEKKRSLAGVTAAAHGLVLEEVLYDPPLFKEERVPHSERK
jgi:tRNA pseudouridine38-40 synthase